MKKTSNLHLGRKIGTVFSRFHMTLFIVFIVSGLSYSVVLINNILNDPNIGSTYQSPISAGSIDQATLERINSLHASDEALPAALPNNERTNPFTE